MTRRNTRILTLLASAAIAALSLPAMGRETVELLARPAPLVEAAEARDTKALDELLKGQADVNQRAADGTTALHWAVYHNEVALLRRLIAAGADVNARNDYDATPLSEAVVTGNVEVIRLLLKAGADVETANADGQTPLDYRFVRYRKAG